MSEQEQSRGFTTANNKDADPLLLRVRELEKAVEDLRASIVTPDPHPAIFPANQSQNKFWQELITNAGTLTNLGAASVGTDIRGCTETSSGSTLLTLADGQGIVVETYDVSGMRPVWLPNPASMVYLTQNGTNNTFDVYVDAAKTIKVASAVTPETTNAFLQWNGTNSRLIVASSSSPLTTKGDLWGYSTVNARLPVGSNGQVLMADSTQTLGVKWAPPSSIFTLVGTTGTAGQFSFTMDAGGVAIAGWAGTPLVAPTGDLVVIHILGNVWLVLSNGGTNDASLNLSLISNSPMS